MHKEVPLFLPASFFLVRAACFPIQNFYSHFKGKAKSILVDACLQDPHFRQALAFSSQSLSRQIRKGKINQDIVLSLYKYFSRITSRGTPYGLLSFVSWGEPGEYASSQLHMSLLKKRARPDMGWMHGYIEMMIRNHENITDFTLQNNPIITERNDRYITTYFVDKREQESASIRKNALTTFIFSQCNSPIAVKTLIGLVRKRFPEATLEPIMGIIKTLLDQQFLWYTLYPNMNTFSPLVELIKQVPLQCKKKLEDLERKIKEYNSLLINEGEECLIQITDKMSEEVQSRRFPLQVDLGIAEKQINLPQKLLEDVAKAGEILWRLNTLKEKPLPLKKYHLKFLEKYGQRRLVPLHELLDPIKGLGSPEYDKKASEIDSPQLSQYYQWLGEELSKALKKGGGEMVIEEKILLDLVPQLDSQKAHSSLDIFFEIYANSLQTLNKGEYQILITNFVNRGGATFGRFMDLLSPEVFKKLKAFYVEESSLEKDTVFVESFYLPQNSNVQNVAISPSFLSDKIDLTPQGKSTINLDQIYVGATKEFLYLTDEVGSKDLRFVATNVLVDIHAPEQVRFIREVSQQRTTRMHLFSWGPFASHTYLPRVRYQNLILSPQRWMITLSCLKANKKQTVQEISDKLASWIFSWELPKYVFITEGDNRLLINSSCKEHLSIAATYLKKEGRIFLIEKIGQEKGEWVQSDQGNHSVEFVLPLKRNPAYANSTRTIPQIAYQKISCTERRKIPGNQWLYYKFQLSSKFHPEFLQMHLSPFADQLRQKKQIEDWFFIRYQENEKEEIRFRMKIACEDLVFPVFTEVGKLAQDLLETDWLQDVSIATYEREIERYGGLEFIELFEKLFCEDSYLTLKLLTFESKELPIYVIGTLSVLEVVKHLFSEPSKIYDFFSRLDLDKKGLLGYKNWRKIIEEGFTSFFGPIGDSRAEILKEIAGKIRKLGISPLVNPYSLAASFVHMHCNRLCGIDPSLENTVTNYAAHFIKNSLVKDALPTRAWKDEG